MNLKKIVKTFAISMLLAVTSTTANAQDLLARQAPVDRKMAAVDTIMLRNITMREELESPSADLYANWDNKYAHRATELPETYKIDLRHFTMPTTSRVITSNFGSRWGRQHKGLDIKVYIGDTIRAAFSGKVRIVRYEAGGYGKYIVIRHNNGPSTATSQSSSSRRTRRFVRARLSVSAAIRAAAPVRISTSKHVFAALRSTRRLCSTSARRT